MARVADITAAVEKITPAQAARMLNEDAAPQGQRPIDRRRVQSYIRDLREGNWLVTGETVCFNSGKAILNGRHRLTACKESGIPFTTVVVRGVDAAAFVVMDTGKGRNLGDSLRLLGETNVNELASAVTMCWKYDTGNLVVPVTPTRAEAIAWLGENPGIRDAVKAGNMIKNRIKAFPKTPATASLYLTERVAPGEGYEFWDAVKAGANLAEGSTLLAFTRWCNGWAGKRDKPDRVVFFAYAVKAMNAYRSGRELRAIRWTRAEGAPRIWGSE